MALLVGRHLNKIDKKGRVSVPKPYREAVLGEGFAGVYIYPHFKYPALEGAGEAFMERLSSSLEDNLELFSDTQDDLVAITLESAFQLSFDPEGRIGLPMELCQHAGLDGQALFVGRGARFQIWSPDVYAARHGDALTRAKANGATLQLSPRPDSPSDRKRGG